MVNCIRYKDSKVNLRTLKSRKLDFFRINPRSIVKLGRKKLVRKGMLAKDSQLPNENPNHFITTSLIGYWSKTRFDDNDMHVGFTVTIKTVSKRANKRNLAKRRMKNAVNENIRAFKVQGHDFVFTARAEILNIPYADIVKDVKRILKFAEYRIKGVEQRTFIKKKYGE